MFIFDKVVCVILLKKRKKKKEKKVVCGRCYVHNIFTIFSRQIIGDYLLLVQIWT